VDFGADLYGSGVKKYRWSYRRLTDSARMPLVVADDWHQLSRSVTRHYRSWTGPHAVDPLVPLGPLEGGPGNFFRVWNSTTSATPIGIENHDWQIDDDVEDQASGFFETHLLDASDDAEDHKAGLYELKLELFHEDNSRVDWTAEGISVNEAGATSTDGTLDLPPAIEAHLVREGSSIVGYRLTVFVDNSRCEAALTDVSVDTHQAGACGFIEYPPGASAYVAFVARHAHDRAMFWFEVDKGSSGAVDPASVGRAGDTATYAPVGVAANGFTRAADSTWTKLVPVTGPNSLVDSPMPCPDGKAAFLERLGVCTLSIHGHGPADWLDAGAPPKAFALAPSTP